MDAIVLVLLTSQFLLLPTEAVTRRRQLTDKELEKNGPAIPGSIKEVLAQTGRNAILSCELTDPGSGIVTWVRRRDRQLLTVGSSTHSADTRFVVEPINSDWSLVIRNVRRKDAGLYECQIPTEPIQHRFVWLKITEAYSVILGAHDLHVKQGSNLRLECQLMEAAEPPIYVFWYRQGRMINYDAEPGVKVEATRNGSILTVNRTKPSHGGNYTCLPNNAKPSSVIIHVTEEEEIPAAMHGGDRRNSNSNLSANVTPILLILLGIAVPRRS